MLEIAGVSFALREGLPAEAAENTAAAGAFLLELLRQSSYDRFDAVESESGGRGSFFLTPTYGLVQHI